ncbi:MAG: sialidase family protein [Rhodospirillales bacterium]|nr:sialidase family protein [Rhodospirillales bacterium]
MEADFIFDVSPVASVHASTLAGAPDGGLLAAWFGGSFEGHADVGIWLAKKRDRRRWSEPRLVADGVQADGQRFSCWNPVLHPSRDGTLSLFYKVGPSPRRWWGMVARSHDGGRSWDPSERLLAGILGPIKNKPVETADGMLISPSSSEHDGWRVHLEYSHDGGRTWRAGKPLNSGRDFAAIQPCILAFSRGFQLLCRSRQGVITECRSADGLHWSKMRATALPNPDSGIDAAVLADGRGVVVYNHSSRRRTPLNVAVSRDEGRSWAPMLVLEREAGEFSYPAVIVDAAGMVQIAYTWNRQTIRHVTVDPRELCRLA